MGDVDTERLRDLAALIAEGVDGYWAREIFAAANEIDRLREELPIALLKAAMLHRDILDAAPYEVIAGMPPDIYQRLMSTEYQDAFDRLPEAVRNAAREIAMEDPLVQEALRIDSEGRMNT